MPTMIPAPDQTDRFDRRQRIMLAAAWGATLLPLVAFGYLTWQSVQLNRQVLAKQEDLRAATQGLEKIREKMAEAETRLAKVNADLQAQRESTKHYRDFAGVRIQFYRESDRQVVEKALADLGFNIDSRLGQSALINRQPNTIAFGSLVSTEDLRDIATALVAADFPLKRIAPAMRQPDPKLIQIYASVESDASCGLLTVEQIRSGMTCGPKPAR